MSKIAIVIILEINTILQANKNPSFFTISIHIFKVHFGFKIESICCFGKSGDLTWSQRSISDWFEDFNFRLFFSACSWQNDFTILWRYHFLQSKPEDNNKTYCMQLHFVQMNKSISSYSYDDIKNTQTSVLIKIFLTLYFFCTQINRKECCSLSV